MMNLKQLETFVRVAEIGSFSKAALVLDTVQPALSRQVRQLEIDLHVTLLERTGRGVVLTEAGKRLFEHSVGILALVARAREDLEASRDEPAGRVVLGMPPSLGRQLTVPLVETFKREWPKAQLAVVEALSAHVAEWIATGRVDIGLLYNPEPHAALETEPLRAEPLCLVSAASSREGSEAETSGRPGRDEKPIALAELVRLPLVIPERSHAIRRLVEAQAALAGIKLNVAWEISSVPAILALVAGGHGHAVLARDALSGEWLGKLQARPVVEPALVHTLCLATSATKRVTPLQKSVLAWLRGQLRGR
ncbi:MAG: LysR family transcriptional regulator [Rubrivivax sp.]|jgi:LysR family nitrogen assimilation transcriptional regulator|nr:LysR family transcriptional regulator [Rubrivivax sp.]